MIKEEYKELIEKNKVFAEHIRQNNLSDEEIRHLMENADIFLLKILSNKVLYEKLRAIIYDYLKNFEEVK